MDDTLQELIGSSQYVTFPFTPKTFYVDVVRRPVSKALAESKGIHFIEDGFGECYYTVLKDPSQLDEVFKYYTKKFIKLIEISFFDIMISMENNRAILW